MKKILVLIWLSNLALAQWQKIETKEINSYRQLNGEVEAVNKSTVSAQTAGRVAKINYDIDDFVAKGSVLVEFTNDEQSAKSQQAKSNASAAKIAYEQAQTDYLRIKDIFVKKLVAKSKLDQALSNRNALKARSAAAQSAVVSANKQLEYTVIRAPYDGIVTNRYVEPGEVVNPGTPIMEGLSLKQLRVITHIPEKIINLVKSNPQAVILNNGKEIPSKEITIFPYAEKLSRTFKARIDVDADQSGLFPGMTVKVAFKTGSENKILIPKTALVTRAELIMVYVKHNDKKLLRHIKIGSQYGDQISVVAGLKVNEEVLINPLSQ